MINKFTSMLALVLIVSGVFVANAYADLGWHVVYEHDANGSSIQGSLDNLVSAIEKGADVKIIRDTGQSVFIPTIHTVSINKSGSVPIVGVRGHVERPLQYDANGNYVFQNSLYNMYILMNSTGVVEYANYSFSGTKISHTTYQWSMKWLVKY